MGFFARLAALIKPDEVTSEASSEAETLSPVQPMPIIDPRRKVYQDIRSGLQSELSVDQLGNLLGQLGRADEGLVAIGRQQLHNLFEATGNHFQIIECHRAALREARERLEEEMKGFAMKESKKLLEQRLEDLRAEEEKLLRSKLRVALTLKTFCDLFLTLEQLRHDRGEEMQQARKQIEELKRAEALSKQTLDLIVAARKATAASEAELKVAYATVSPTLIEIVDMIVERKLEAMMACADVLGELNIEMASRIGDPEQLGQLLFDGQNLKRNLVEAYQVGVQGETVVLPDDGSQLDTVQVESTIDTIQRSVGTALGLKSAAIKAQPEPRSEVHTTFEEIRNRLKKSEAGAKNEMLKVLSERPQLTTGELDSLASSVPRDLAVLASIVTNYPCASEDILVALYYEMPDKSIEAIEKLLQHPSADKKLFDLAYGRIKLTGDTNPQFIVFLRCAIESKPALFLDYLQRYVKQMKSFPFWLDFVLQLESLSGDTLLEIVDLRLSIAQEVLLLSNPNCPPAVWKKIAERSTFTSEQAHAYIDHPRAPAEVLSIAASSADFAHREKIKSHPNFNSGVEAVLALLKR